MHHNNCAVFQTLYLKFFTCKKLTQSSNNEYELIPPEYTSLRSRMNRNCFSKSISFGKTENFSKNF